MTETRSGEGMPTSRTAAKETMGRTFVTMKHEGQLSRGTEYQASARLAGFKSQEGPTQQEMQMIFNENPSDVKAFKAAGMSQTEIYDILKNR